MVTIKDIAKYAGVSHGTVSNVINKSNKVSADKIILVEQAIQALGYNVNTQASQLRAQTSNQIAVILPTISRQRYADFYKGVVRRAQSTEYTPFLICMDDVAWSQTKAVQKAISQNPMATIVVPDLDDALEKQKELHDLYFFEREPNGHACVTFDFYQAGRAMAYRCVEKGLQNIAIACESTLKNTHFLEGACQVLDEEKRAYTIFEPMGDNSFCQAFSITTDPKGFDGVMVQNQQTASYMVDLMKFSVQEKPMKIISLGSTTLISQYGVDRYQLDYRLAGSIMVDHILQKKTLEQTQVLPGSGFSIHYSHKCENEQTNLRVLMLQSPTSESLKRLLPQFERHSGIKVKLVEMPYNDLFQEAQDNENTKLYDMIRLDMAWSEVLSPKLFLDLSQLEDTRILDRIAPQVPAEFFGVDQAIYTLPLDASVQLLVYRKDLFNHALTKRKYYEQYKKQLVPPTTFEEFRTVAEFFTRSLNPSSKTLYGANLVHGTTATASLDYLPRLLQAGGLIFDGQKVSIDQEIYLKTVQDYLQLRDYADDEVDQWWSASMDKMLRGDLAMCVVYSNHATIQRQYLKPSDYSKLGYAPVPHGQSFLGGGVLGISKSTQHRSACMEFLSWLYSDEIANACTCMGGFVASKHIFDNQTVMGICPWLENVQQTLGQGKRRLSHQNTTFNNVGFEAALGKSIRLIAQNIITPQEGFTIVKNYIDSVN